MSEKFPIPINVSGETPKEERERKRGEKRKEKEEKRRDRKRRPEEAKDLPRFKRGDLVRVRGESAEGGWEVKGVFDDQALIVKKDPESGEIISQRSVLPADVEKAPERSTEATEGKTSFEERTRRAREMTEGEDERIKEEGPERRALARASREVDRLVEAEKWEEARTQATAAMRYPDRTLSHIAIEQARKDIEGAREAAGQISSEGWKEIALRGIEEIEKGSSAEPAQAAGEREESTQEPLDTAEAGPAGGSALEAPPPPPEDDGSENGADGEEGAGQEKADENPIHNAVKSYVEQMAREGKDVSLGEVVESVAKETNTPQNKKVGLVTPVQEVIAELEKTGALQAVEGKRNRYKTVIAEEGPGETGVLPEQESAHTQTPTPDVSQRPAEAELPKPVAYPKGGKPFEGEPVPPVDSAVRGGVGDYEAYSTEERSQEDPEIQRLKEEWDRLAERQLEIKSRAVESDARIVRAKERISNAHRELQRTKYNSPPTDESELEAHIEELESQDPDDFLNKNPRVNREQVIAALKGWKEAAEERVGHEREFSKMREEAEIEEEKIQNVKAKLSEKGVDLTRQEKQREGRRKEKERAGGEVRTYIGEYITQQTRGDGRVSLREAHEYVMRQGGIPKRETTRILNEVQRILERREEEGVLEKDPDRTGVSYITTAQTKAPGLEDLVSGHNHEEAEAAPERDSVEGRTDTEPGPEEEDETAAPESDQNGALEKAAEEAESISDPATRDKRFLEIAIAQVDKERNFEGARVTADKISDDGKRRVAQMAIDAREESAGAGATAQETAPEPDQGDSEGRVVEEDQRMPGTGPHISTGRAERAYQGIPEHDEEPKEVDIISDITQEDREAFSHGVEHPDETLPPTSEDEGPKNRERKLEEGMEGTDLENLKRLKEDLREGNMEGAKAVVEEMKSPVSKVRALVDIAEEEKYQGRGEGVQEALRQAREAAREIKQISFKGSAEKAIEETRGFLERIDDQLRTSSDEVLQDGDADWAVELAEKMNPRNRDMRLETIANFLIYKKYPNPDLEKAKEVAEMIQEKGRREKVEGNIKRHEEQEDLPEYAEGDIEEGSGELEQKQGTGLGLFEGDRVKIRNGDGTKDGEVWRVKEVHKESKTATISSEIEGEDGEQKEITRSVEVIDLEIQGVQTLSALLARFEDSEKREVWEAEQKMSEAEARSEGQPSEEEKEQLREQTKERRGYLKERYKAYVVLERDAEEDIMRKGRRAKNHEELLAYIREETDNEKIAGYYEDLQERRNELAFLELEDMLEKEDPEQAKELRALPQSEKDALFTGLSTASTEAPITKDINILQKEVALAKAEYQIHLKKEDEELKESVQARYKRALRALRYKQEQNEKVEGESQVSRKCNLYIGLEEDMNVAGMTQQEQEEYEAALLNTRNQIAVRALEIALNKRNDTENVTRLNSLSDEGMAELFYFPNESVDDNLRADTIGMLERKRAVAGALRKIYSVGKNEKLEDDYDGAIERIDNAIERKNEAPGGIRAKQERTQYEAIQKGFEGFNITNEELRRIQGFKELSVGKQALVLENLRQVVLARVQEEAKESADTKLAEDTRDVGRVQRALKYVLRPARVLEEEKRTAGELRYGGMEAHEETIRFFTKVVGESEGDIKIRKDGSLETQYINPEDYRAREKKVVRTFNEAASAYSEIMYDWTSRTAKGKEQKKLQETKEAYEKAKGEMLEVEAGRIGDRDAAMWVASVSKDIELQQILNTNKDAEGLLQDIELLPAWQRIAKQAVLDRWKGMAVRQGARGATMALSPVGAALGIQALAVAAPLAMPVGLAIGGGYMGKWRAEKAIREEEKSGRRGEAGEKVRNKKEALASAFEELKNAKDSRTRAGKRKKIRKLEEQLFKIENTSSNFVDAKKTIKVKYGERTTEREVGVTEKLESLMQKIESGDFPTDEEIREKRKQAGKEWINRKRDEMEEGGERFLPRHEGDIWRRVKARYPTEEEALRARVEYTKRKFGEGLINFGKSGEQAKNKYEFLQTLLKAEIMLADRELKKEKSGIEDRLERVLNIREARISDAQKKEIRKKIKNGAAAGALVGAGAVVGVSTWLRDLWPGADHPIEVSREARGFMDMVAEARSVPPGQVTAKTLQENFGIDLENPDLVTRQVYGLYKGGEYTPAELKETLMAIQKGNTSHGNLLEIAHSEMRTSAPMSAEDSGRADTRIGQAVEQADRGAEAPEIIEQSEASVESVSEEAPTREHMIQVGKVKPGEGVWQAVREVLKDNPRYWDPDRWEGVENIDPKSTEVHDWANKITGELLIKPGGYIDPETGMETQVLLGDNMPSYTLEKGSNGELGVKEWFPEEGGGMAPGGVEIDDVYEEKAPTPGGVADQAAEEASSEGGKTEPARASEQLRKEEIVYPDADRVVQADKSVQEEAPANIGEIKTVTNERAAEHVVRSPFGDIPKGPMSFTKGGVSGIVEFKGSKDLPRIALNFGPGYRPDIKAILRDGWEEAVKGGGGVEKKAEQLAALPKVIAGIGEKNQAAARQLLQLFGEEMARFENRRGIHVFRNVDEAMKIAEKAA